jgi:hypothetical protein
VDGERLFISSPMCSHFLSPMMNAVQRLSSSRIWPCSSTQMACHTSRIPVAIRVRSRMFLHFRTTHVFNQHAHRLVKDSDTLCQMTASSTTWLSLAVNRAKRAQEQPYLTHSKLHDSLRMASTGRSPRALAKGAGCGRAQFNSLLRICLLCGSI